MRRRSISSTDRIISSIIILEVLVIMGLIFLLFFYPNNNDSKIKLINRILPLPNRNLQLPNSNNSNRMVPIGALPFLKTSGQDIVNQNGEKVFLRGVNYGNWLLWEGCGFGILDCASYPEYKLKEEMYKRIGYEKTEQFFDLILDNFIQEDDFERVKDLDMNFVRLGFHYRYVKEDQLTLLDEAVSWAKEAGVYVILNMHAAPGAQAPTYFADSDGNAYLWESFDYQEQYLDLWKILATRYKDESIVAGYEILNEPVANTNQQLTDLYIKTVDLIRNIDNNHIIFLDGNDLASDFTALDHNFGDNIVYVFHTYIETQAGLEAIVNNFNYYGYREKYQVPLMCNEYAYFSYNNYFEDNNINWAPWTYKALYAAPPLYSMPEGNLWRNWIENLNSNYNKSLISSQQQFIDIVQNSNLSAGARQDIIDLILAKDTEGLKYGLTQLQQTYPLEAGELENVYTQIKSLAAELKYAADADWLDDFTASINNMSDTELNSLMQSLQTRYW